MRFSDAYDEQAGAERFEKLGHTFSLARYTRYWYLFALGIVLSLGGAYGYLRYTTPQYSITSLLLLKDKKNETENAKNERFSDFNNINASKNIDNEIVVLKSVSLMQRVLKELDSEISYYKKESLREREVYQADLPFRLVVTKLDSAAFGKRVVIELRNNNQFTLQEAGEQQTTHQFGQLVRKPYGQFTVLYSPSVASVGAKQPVIIKFQDSQKLAASYAKKISVVPVNKQTTILSLTLMDNVPERGRDILNKLVEVYNKDAAEDKNLMATNTINFIDERLGYLATELSKVEKGVEKFKRKNQVADVASQIEQSLAEAGEYNKQLSEYTIQMAVLESIEEYVTKEGNEQQMIPGTLNVPDPTLSGLIVRFNALQLDRERMLQTAQPSNPVVLSMTEQLTNLRANILQTLGSVKNSLSISQRNLQAKSGQFGSQMQQVPTIERGLQEISRQQELKQALYLYLLQKREEAALSLAATVSNARVIDPATVSDAPVSPQKLPVLLTALLLGLGLPFAFVYIKERMNDQVQRLQDVEWSTNALILGEIAHNRSGQEVVVAKETRTPIAEMFRLVRSNLHFATAGKPHQTILVTSSRSGEGKTFFSLNLSASLVLAGKRVVLLNLDLRKPNGMLAGEKAPQKGLTDYLLSEAVSVDDIVRPSRQVEGLYVIEAGELPSNPAEVIMSPRMAKMLDILRESFDHIILDSAPVGQVADAFALAPYIDATIYVVRYNFTQKPQLEIINRIQVDNKLNQLMLVLNDAKKSNLSKYGYGYGYQESKKKFKGSFSA